MGKPKKQDSVNENTNLVLKRKQERDQARRDEANKTPNRTGRDWDEDE